MAPNSNLEPNAHKYIKKKEKIHNKKLRDINLTNLSIKWSSNQMDDMKIKNNTNKL